MKEIDKLAWLYIKDGKLLTARSINKNLFYIPGGKRDEGESDEQALIREVKEEISVDIIPNSIKYAGTFSAQADEKPDDVMVKLTCYFADFKGQLRPDAEIEEIKFLNLEEKLLCSAASIVVMDWLKNKNILQ